MNEPKIIYEDSEFFVIEKPSGWITDSASTTKNQLVIQEWVAENLQFSTNGVGQASLINNFQFRNGIVHRLDKETSGLLLIAKTKEAFEELQRQFKERLVSKTYIALVHGVVNPLEGEIKEPVGRLPWRRDRFGVLVGGREAVTKYKTLSLYTVESSPLTLLELTPKTGRTHQIRIHLKHIGYPIVADQFYAGRKTARKDRKWCPRLFLHAKGITFINPVTKKKISFESKLADDLRVSLEQLTVLA